MQHPIHDIVAYAQWAGHNAENHASKLTMAELRLPGMSGKKGRHLLNNLCSLPGLRYLEVGMWQGSTFCSALHQNSIKAVGIDNWSEFGGPKQAFDANVARYLGKNEVKIFNQAVFTVPHDAVMPNVDVYFYDGGHTEEEQYKAI